VSVRIIPRVDGLLLYISYSSTFKVVRRIDVDDHYQEAWSQQTHATQQLSGRWRTAPELHCQCLLVSKPSQQRFWQSRRDVWLSL